jgi:DNA polymerase III subunit delta'
MRWPDSILLPSCFFCGGNFCHLRAIFQSMPRIEFKSIVGQERIRETLAAAITSGQVGQAYLFCGDAGVGKLPMALEFALALLCTAAKAVPCMKCESCRKVLEYAHPDFHIAMPVALSKEHKGSDGKLSEIGWEYLHTQCKERITDPYAIAENDGIADIPVEWIREINHAISRGAVGAQRNVAIICGIDTMNRPSANAMLKTLEEPPANTVIVLTTERPHAVLPTIVSRCQILRFGSIRSDDLAEALAKQVGVAADDPRIVSAVRCAEGSLGRAQALFSQPVDDLMLQAKEIVGLCREGDRLQMAAKLDEMGAAMLDGGRNYGMAERLLTYCLYVVRDSFMHGIGASEKYIRKEYATPVPAGAALNCDTAALLSQACQQAIAAVKARGNLQLVLASWALTTMEILHGK